MAVYPQKNQSSYAGIPSIVSCNTNGNGRRKRSWSRAVFSNLQRKGLEKRFQIQKYITKPDRRQLAATLGLTDAQVMAGRNRELHFDFIIRYIIWNKRDEIELILQLIGKSMVPKSSNEMETYERREIW